MPRASHRIRCPGVHATLIAAALATLLQASCAQPPPTLAQIRARGELRVVTLNAPTTYYLGARGPEGMEYRLAAEFAKQLGVHLNVQQARDATAMRAALTDGSADIAAAQITANEAWRSVGLVTSTYDHIPQLVIQARGKSRPRDITNLRGTRIVVASGSPQAYQLSEIRRNSLPDLTWSELSRDAVDPLARVNAGEADYAIVDADEFAFARHLYPEAIVAFTLPEPRPVQWIVPLGATDLRGAVNRFFAGAASSGLLAKIEKLTMTESRDFDYLEAHRFQSDISDKLPQLQPLFEAASVETGLDWRLLAAVGYQESKWDQKASSANDAVGIMMLTPDAATAVGINDRTDLKQNILGGARYLAQVLDTVPDRIAEPDRTWLGLAAYNVGYGHLEDARVLAQSRGKDPDSWNDVREQLPLLAEEQWYVRVKRGYARGWEPATFVEQVRQYLAVLEWGGAGTLAHDASPGAMTAPATAEAQPSATTAQKESAQQAAALLR